MSSEPCLGRGGGLVRWGWLSSLHGGGGCVGESCGRLGMGSHGLPRTLGGLSGQSAMPLGQEGHWAGACRWGRGYKPPGGGDLKWEGHWPGQAHAGPCWRSCVWRGCLCYGAWLVARSYLAGVNAALRIASTDVVRVDGPSVPPAAVTDVDINEADLGLLQHIR